MVKERILVCWMGLTDLRAMAATLPGPAAADLRKRNDAGPGGELGSPIKILVEKENFSQVHLLSNLPKGEGEAFGITVVASVGAGVAAGALWLLAVVLVALAAALVAVGVAIAQLAAALVGLAFGIAALWIVVCIIAASGGRKRKRRR